MNTRWFLLLVVRLQNKIRGRSQFGPKQTKINVCFFVLCFRVETRACLQHVSLNYVKLITCGWFTVHLLRLLIALNDSTC